MNAKEAKKLSDSYKGWDEERYKSTAIYKVDKLIRESCETNSYDISIDEGDDWMITKYLDYVVAHFESLGYCVIKGYMIDDRMDTMVNISWD